MKTEVKTLKNNSTWNEATYNLYILTKLDLSQEREVPFSWGKMRSVIHHINRLMGEKKSSEHTQKMQENW